MRDKRTKRAHSGQKRATARKKANQEAKRAKFKAEAGRLGITVFELQQLKALEYETPTQPREVYIPSIKERMRSFT